MNSKKNKTRQLITLTQFERVWLILLFIYFLRNLKKEEKKEFLVNFFFKLQSKERYALRWVVQKFLQSEISVSQKNWEKVFFFVKFFSCFQSKERLALRRMVVKFLQSENSFTKKVSQSKLKKRLIKISAGEFINFFHSSS